MFLSQFLVSVPYPLEALQWDDWWKWNFAWECRESRNASWFIAAGSGAEIWKKFKNGKKKPIKLSMSGCFHMMIAASLPSVNAGAGSSIDVRWEPSGSSPCVDLSLHLSLASSLFLLPLSVSSYKQFYQWCSLLPCLRDGSLFTRTYLDTENMLFFQESFWCVLIWDLHQQMRLGGRKNKQG